MNTNAFGRRLLLLPLIVGHRHQRLQWCQERRHWRDGWKPIVFSDESLFHFLHYDGWFHVQGHLDERHLEVCIWSSYTDLIGAGNGDGFYSRFRLLRIVGTQPTIGDVLESELPTEGPWCRFSIGKCLITCSTEHQHFLNACHVSFLSYPARSADLLPIEKVWDMVLAKTGLSDLAGGCHQWTLGTQTGRIFRISSIRCHAVWKQLSLLVVDVPGTDCYFLITSTSVLLIT